MYFKDYWCCLAVALDIQERQRYWQFQLAGGKEKDWRWSSADRAGISPLARRGSPVQDAIMSWAGQKGVPRRKGNLSSVAKKLGWQEYRRDEATGKVYDMEGKEIDMRGAIFVPSRADNSAA